MIFLLVSIGLGFMAFPVQMNQGLRVTGMGRGVSWGLYIAQLTFFVGVAASALLLIPSTRRNEGALSVTCVMALIALWIDKGLCLVIAGFIPNPFERVTRYTPTGIEVMITLGIYSAGAFVLTLFYRIVVSVKREVEE